MRSDHFIKLLSFSENFEMMLKGCGLLKVVIYLIHHLSQIDTYCIHDYLVKVYYLCLNISVPLSCLTL